MPAQDTLQRYRAKRNFSATPEPADAGESSPQGMAFVVQKHWASSLHYDFRLELDGVMKSWAVPKGPSFDSRDRRMATHVEDHPISYNPFEGTIAPGQYGAGKVIIWDKGTWLPLGDPEKGYRDGNLKFELRGIKLHGKWVLVRMKGRGEKQQPWLLIKEKDAFVRPALEFSVVDELPDSVQAAAMPAAEAVAGAMADKSGKADTTARAAATATIAKGRKGENPDEAAPAAKQTSGATRTASGNKRGTLATVGEKAAGVELSASAPAAPVSKSLGTRVRVTNPERVIDASSGITKVELVRYYDLIGGLMLPHLKGRPVALLRAPAGIGGELFFQKHADVGKLPGVRQLDPALDMGHPAMLEVASRQGLLSAAQWNVVEFHTLNTASTSFEHPDRMVFDLDPGEGVDWSTVQQAAQLVNGFLAQLGLTSFLKTSGGKGLHVVVPVRKVHDWDTVKDFSQAVVAHLAKTIPQMFVARSGAKNRVGKIFVDYLRNGVGASTACAWSARARSGMGISVPVEWDELASLKGGDHWNIRTAKRRLDRGNGPWDGYAKAAKSLTSAIKMLG